MKKIYLFLIGMLCSFPLWAETIHVPSPGDLREALMDAEFTGTQLKITGTLNGADLAAIHAADGRLANVTELDLSEVALEASDDCYATYSWAGDCYFESSSFYYSETCKRDSTVGSNMLGTEVVQIKVYDNNLAGLFVNNKTYQKVILPKALSKIGSEMFLGSKVHDIVFPSAFTAIEMNAFANSNVTKINLPESCKTIGDAAFSSSLLTSINLENVTLLGKNSFRYSKLQGDIKLGKLSEVPVGCFSGCNLSSVIFQKGLKRIGESAFRENASLKSLSLPEGLEYIGERAFWGCGFQTMDIPKSLSYAGPSAFPENFKSFDVVDGVCYAGQVAYAYSSAASSKTSLKFRDGTLGISKNLASSRYAPKTTLVSLEIPSSVKMISEYEQYSSGEGVFQDYTNLETVVLPEDLEILGNSTFKGCKSLKNINLPNSLLAIPKSTFEGCESLNNINIPNGLRKIEEKAFYGCESLKNVTFPKSLRYIGNYAFEYSGITSVSLGEDIEYLGASGFSYCKSLLSMRIDMQNLKDLYLTGTPIEQITFGPKVSNIRYGFMSGVTSLQKVVFEEDENFNTPLVIDGKAFKDCSNLRIASLPRRLAKVDDDAFYGIKEITSLYLGQNVTEINGYSAFANIKQIGELYYDAVPELYGIFDESGINKITIGTHVTYIGRAFNNNSKLTTVIFESRKGIKDAEGLLIESFNNCSITSVVFPEYDEGLPRNVELDIRRGFNNNPIKELTMPDNVLTTIFGGFKKCQIEKVYLGDNTYSVEDSSFIGNNLKWVDIPPSVYCVEGSAFDAEYLFAHNRFRSPKKEDKYKINILCPIKLKEEFESYIDKDVARVIGYDLQIQEGSLWMKVGETMQLHPIFTVEEDLPSLPEIKYVWMSSGPDVLSVDQNGVVTALKKYGEVHVNVSIGISYLPKYYFFDSFSPWIIDADTSIGNVHGDGNGISFDTHHGEIAISGAKDDSKVNIYSLGGQCVRTTKEKTISGLASGIYIVTVENQKFKVMLP